MGSTSLQLSDNISNALSVLSEFDTLEEVDLSNNMLVGSIPAQLSSLSGLTTFDVSYNTLNGPIPWALVSWAIARRLQLDVRGNKLTLPNDITEEGGRTLVTSVDVSGWGLTGTIPVQLSSLSALAVLNLGNNVLTGTIPAQLSSLSGLTVFDLSYNTLRGPIPSSLGSLTALQVLRLNNNCIVGGIIPAGVPSANFSHRTGDCEMGGQCSACSDAACCLDSANNNCRPSYDGTRLDTPMCRACGYYSTGLCLVSNNCSNSTRSKDWCGADCSNTADSSIYEVA
jgi:hypothetical protein